MTALRRRALPLAAWAGLLSAATVLGTVATTAVVLDHLGSLDARAVAALAAGGLVGLVLSLVGLAAAAHLAAAVSRLHADALHRLREPSGPVGRPADRPTAVRLTVELADLARVLDALHLRVRVADDLGERHRVAAATAGHSVAALLHGLVSAEEGARGQLAAELHDTVAQSLMIARGLLAGPAGTVDLARVTDYVEDAEEQVRAVMARTRPPALRDGDLASAVAQLRDDLRARYGLEVHVTWPATAAPLPLASAVTAYRFCQEALLNVVKHADVDDAWLELRLESGALVVTVRDEGPGFAPDQVRPDRGRHVGLGLLRERARVSGGRVEVRSGDRTGTLLLLHLPHQLPSSRDLAEAARAAAVPLPVQRTGEPLSTG